MLIVAIHKRSVVIYYYAIGINVSRVTTPAKVANKTREKLTSSTSFLAGISFPRWKNTKKLKYKRNRSDPMSPLARSKKRNSCPTTAVEPRLKRVRLMRPPSVAVANNKTWVHEWAT
jgi:hypothetical protein